MTRGNKVRRQGKHTLDAGALSKMKTLLSFFPMHPQQLQTPGHREKWPWTAAAERRGKQGQYLQEQDTGATEREWLFVESFYLRTPDPFQLFQQSQMMGFELLPSEPRMVLSHFTKQQPWINEKQCHSSRG